jgi:hypothetical protein
MSLGGSINYLTGEETAKADQTMRVLGFRPWDLWKMRAKARARTEIR